ISGMTITGGHAASGSDGGAIFNDNFSTLTLMNVKLSGNATSDASLVRAGRGGAIHNRGTIKLINSIVSENVTGKGDSSSFANGGEGGGIYNDSQGVMNIINSTASNNATGNGAPITGHDGNGGGIYNSGKLTLTNATISGNTTGNGSVNTPGGNG